MAMKQRQIESACSHLCTYVLRESLPASASLLGKTVNKAVQDPRFLFMEGLVTVKAVSIHVLNEIKVIWHFSEKGKKYIQEAD